MKKNSTSSRIIAILLLFSMIIGLAPMKAHANPADPATFDFSSSKIDIVPTGDLTRKGTGVLGIRYNSPNFPSVNNQPGGSYYNIAMTGTNYRAIGLCLNKEKKLDDAARVWSNITPIESFNEPNINGAIMDEVKPYLDFYYYATHSAEGRSKFNWSEKKSVAFTRAVQNILWLNIAGLTSGKTKAEKEEMYIREMQAAIAKLNEGLNSAHANYISNDGMPYNYWQCQDSIQVMASGMVARADGTTIIIPKTGFSYCGATSTTPGQQNVLLPHFEPPTTDPNKKEVYIKFQKLDAKTNLPLAGATFEIYKNSTLIGTETTDALGEIRLLMNSGNI